MKIIMVLPSLKFQGLGYTLALLGASVAGTLTVGLVTPAIPDRRLAKA